MTTFESHDDSNNLSQENTFSFKTVNGIKQQASSLEPSGVTVPASSRPVS